MKDWKRIYVDKDRLRLDIIRNTLELHNIKSFIVDKRDSSYNVFGECELYVREEDAINSIHIINTSIDFD